MSDRENIQACHIVRLTNKVAELEAILNRIREMAAEDIRSGSAEGTSLFQIEADARRACEKNMAIRRQLV